MSRTKKKDYPRKYDSKRFDKTCRNNGSCSYCRNNRLHNTHKEEQRSVDQLKDE
jgi:hypothetical protein